jgi:DNA-binding transcriptional ArsR family regulator
VNQHRLPARRPAAAGAIQGCRARAVARHRWRPLLVMSPGSHGRGSSRRPFLICYPSRGVADRWPIHHGDTTRVTADLIGATRTRLLDDLDYGRTTKELAARHCLTANAVSHHVGTLTRASLVDRTRQGREVRYQLNEDGEHLPCRARVTS